MSTVKDFRTSASPWWCPGCGDFGVLSALQKAAAGLDLDPANVALVAGIGCSGKIGDYFNSYSTHVIHGRTMPVATGIKLANKDLTVIAAGGDGDGYGIGLNHFMHAIRRNLDVTYIVMDNHIYGLTKGQASPTSDQGFKAKTTPEGTAERPVKPLMAALSAGITFLAQAFSGDPNGMADLFMQAIRHRGFSLVNCFSPCVTFNKVNTYDYFRENVVDLSEQDDYDPSSLEAALATVTKTGGLIKGVIYREEGPSYEDLLPGSPAQARTQLELDYDNDHWQAIMNEFK